jgi:hypothetical protein
LEFADITPAWFDAHVTIDIVKGCWLADAVQITVGARRVYTAHLALLLHQGLPVTANALDWLRVRRCRRRLHCVRPDHMIEVIDLDAARRSEAINRARAKMQAARAAFRAESRAAAHDGEHTASRPVTSDQTP